MPDDEKFSHQFNQKVQESTLKTGKYCQEEFLKL